jgi:hypothetical protein
MEEKTTIRADVAKNRMYIRLTGSYTVDDTIPVINRINCEVVKLKPGFGVINDIRELKKVDIKAALKIKKGTEIIQEKGEKHIIRVVGNSKFALRIFAKFANLVKNVQVNYVPTLEKAEELLEEHNL